MAPVFTVAAPAGLDPAAFLQPPPASRPLTWMHAMNGNLSGDGLAKDLQALADAGVGGALLFTINRSTPLGPMQFNSPDFRAAIVRGAVEAGRLGLDFGVHNCDGWSSSGGPWVPIEDSMKRVVWSETLVGGGAVDLQLPALPSAHGLSREIAVLAVPATPSERALAALRPRVTIAPEGAEAPGMTDANLSDKVTVRPRKGGTEGTWIRLDYPAPFTARSIYLEHDSRSAKARLEVSEDGETFRPVGPLRGDRTGKARWILEQSFPPVTGRAFRVVFDEAPGGLAVEFVELTPWARLDHWPALTGMATADRAQRESLAGRTDFVPLAAVQDLTSSFDPATGRLRGELPPGDWRVLRFGYTSTGAKNHPATDSGRGWECDKFSAAALDRHFAAYVGKLVTEANAAGPHGLRISEIDSFEMGGQNWTECFPALFKKQAGYDLTRFLPLLAGVPLGDAATTRAVLSDFVGTGAALFAENYFKRFVELCHQHGLRAYIEPYGNGSFNALTVGGHADIPMGEFWMFKESGSTSILAHAVSAAHTYGKPIISAESFTSWADLNWKLHPWLLKQSGDRAWALGVNEFMFHRFAHQANTQVQPGMTMDSIGSQLDRTQTWWLNAGKAWLTYVARGSHLLRQGVPHADVLSFVGEEAPHSVSSRQPLPPGYLLDHCDTVVLHERVRVEGRDLVLPEGTRYRMLALAKGEPLSVATLRRLAELVEAGATLVGAAPPAPVGYLDLTTRRAEYDALVAQLWGGGAPGVRAVGRGQVVSGLDWPEVFAQLKLAPDLLVAGGSTFGFQHRRIGGDDLYFFSNREAEPRVVTVTLRQPDALVDRWHPTDGRIEPLAFTRQVGGGTEVTLTLQALDEVFLVARPRPAGAVTLDAVLAAPPGAAAEPPRWTRVAPNGLGLETFATGDYRVRDSRGTERAVTVAPLPADRALAGAWSVAFTDPFDEKFSREFVRLEDWAQHADTAVRGFSGTAAYRQTLAVTAEQLAAGRLWLDLGTVHIGAEVVLNGRAVATLWKPPFRCDVTDFLRAGDNALEIRVTNLWSNRLIADAALPDETGYQASSNHRMPEWYARNEPPPGPRRTFTTYDFHAKDRDLQPSGLIGPVQLRWSARVALP